MYDVSRLNLSRIDTVAGDAVLTQNNMVKSVKKRERVNFDALVLSVFLFIKRLLNT